MDDSTNNLVPFSSWLAEPPPGAVVFKMKYIRHKKLGFVLFEGSVGHDEVARSLGGREQVMSAGFVFAPGVVLKCLGHSSSLDLSSGPSDESDLVSRMAGV